MAKVDTMFDRVPPHSLEAEKNVLGAILLDPKLIDDVATVVSEDDFYATQHEIIFRTMLESSEIDAVIIAEKLRDHNEFGKGGIMSVLAEIMSSVHVTAHAVHYARVVREKSLTRKRTLSVSGCLGKILEGDDSGEAVEAMEQMLYEIGMNRSGEPVPLSKAIIETWKNEEASGIAYPTGFGEVDNLITGFRQGQMIVPAARPSMGKTALCANIMLRMAKRGTKCLLFSLEMSQEEIVKRMVAVEGECDLKTEVMNTSRPTWTQQKVSEASNAVFGLPIHIDATPGRTMAEIESISRAWVRKHGVEVIFIDHMGWIETGEKRQKEYDKVTEISRRLKNLARKLNVPVVVLSQLSRNVEGRKDFRPRLSDLRSSGAIEQDADVVLFIHREEYYLTKTQAEDQNVRGIAEIIVAKGRNVDVGDVKLIWKAYCTKFDDMPVAEEWNPDGGSSF